MKNDGPKKQKTKTKQNKKTVPIAFSGFWDKVSKLYETKLLTSAHQNNSVFEKLTLFYPYNLCWPKENTTYSQWDEETWTLCVRRWCIDATQDLNWQ